MLYSSDYWILRWLKIGLDSCTRSYSVICIVCHSRILGDEPIHCLLPYTSYVASKVVPHDTLQFLQQKGNPQRLFFSLEKIPTAIWWQLEVLLLGPFKISVSPVSFDGCGIILYLNLPWMFWLYLWPRSINGLDIWFDLGSCHIYIVI